MIDGVRKMSEVLEGKLAIGTIVKLKKPFKQEFEFGIVCQLRGTRVSLHLFGFPSLCTCSFFVCISYNLSINRV